LVRGIGCTQSIRFQAHPAIRELPAGQPVIYGIWHNRLAFSLFYRPVIWRELRRTCRVAALVSASRDGGWLARVMELSGFVPVRGSSSRRGSQALRELAAVIKQGHDVAITPDGPRGPRYVVQEGLVALAQLTGAPIVPVTDDVNWKLTLRSWDAFRVPVPFARCVLRLGAPVFVPRQAAPEERELLRLQVEEWLRDEVGTQGCEARERPARLVPPD
jgi:hypothetical protein